MYLRSTRATDPEDFALKLAPLVLVLLLLGTAAFAQEPVNHAVAQPAALQPTASQPTVQDTSMAQSMNPSGMTPYLSEPIIVPPRQAVVRERPHPVITDLHQTTAYQPSVHDYK